MTAGGALASVGSHSASLGYEPRFPQESNIVDYAIIG